MSGKRCTGCGEVKAVEDFSRDKAKKDGLTPRCKACHRRYREENREAIAEKDRRYYEENCEAIAEYNRRWREENREAHLGRKRRYYEENREAVLESHRRYYEENREAALDSKRRYYEEHREVLIEDQRRRREAMRDMTREVATRNGEPYTPAEDAHILASDEPAAAIAVELGRTMASIAHRRKILRKKAPA